MLDLIVTGGIAVLPSGAAAADIGVAGGRIAAIGTPGSLQSASAARTVDASGQIVIPGGVDPHIHCSMPIPFPGRNEDLLSAPPEQPFMRQLSGENQQRCQHYAHSRRQPQSAISVAVLPA